MLGHGIFAYCLSKMTPYLDDKGQIS